MSLLESLLQPALIDDALIAERREGREHLRRIGLPTARDEAWRYTSLRTLENKTFVLGDAAASKRALPAEILAQITRAELRLAFVNGVLREDLSTRSGLPQGLVVDVNLPPAPSALDSASQDAFQAANLSLAQSGATITVAAGAAIEKPLHVFFIALATEMPFALHLRVRVRLGVGASCTVVETHAADLSAAFLGNRVMEFDLSESAQLMHTRQTAPSAFASSIDASHYRLDGDAKVEAFELTPGQSMQRHRVEVALNGDGACFISGGVAALTGRAHSDTQISVRHRARDTSCDLIWRGIADQRARLGFTGNLVVEADADGADAKLSSKNLLLSSHAEVNTRPVLVIHADEVKAAHGATVGRLDERGLFYLRSRGISLAQARAMMTHAFAIEALKALSDEALRAWMSTSLHHFMAGFVGSGANER